MTPKHDTGLSQTEQCLLELLDGSATVERLASVLSRRAGITGSATHNALTRLRLRGLIWRHKPGTEWKGETHLERCRRLGIPAMAHIYNLTDRGREVARGDTYEPT